MAPSNNRHPLQSLLIISGIGLAVVSGTYLIGGFIGILPLETEAIAWNNVRIVSGVAVLGCLMAAVGYVNE